MTLEEIEKTNRFTYDTAEETGIVQTRDPLIMQELMWSDPGDHTGFKKSGRGGNISLMLSITIFLIYQLTHRVNIHIWQ